MCDRCLPAPRRRDVLKAALALPVVLRLPFDRTETGPHFQVRTVTPGLDIHPRSDWADTKRPPKGTMAGEEVRFLLVHHTAGSNSYDAASVPGQIRGMYDFHTGAEKGWPDVAYNFLIDRFGGVWEARAGSLDGPVSGDATGGNQGYSQLVSLMGDFSSQSPTAEALASLRATLAWLADRSGLDTSPGTEITFESKGSNRHQKGVQVETPTINGHRSMSQTSCPGETLFAYVDGALTADVHSLRSGGPVPTTTAPPVSDSEGTVSDSEGTVSDSEGTVSETPTTTETSAEATASETEIPATSTSVSTPTTASEVSSTDAGSVSSTSPTPDTVDQVAAPLSSDPFQPAGPQRLTAWEGLGLAGAAGIAAVGGLISLRTRRDS